MDRRIRRAVFRERWVAKKKKKKKEKKISRTPEPVART